MHSWDMTEPAPPPEAVLIRQCREAKRPKLSMNAAAKAMKFSGSRWRQIENGYQTIAAGVRSPVVAPAETLAHMAEVVGATPEQLVDAGREDAAQIMRDDRTRLAHGLAALIPTGPSPGAQAAVDLDEDPLSVEKLLIDQGWTTAHELTDAVAESDPSERLLAAARDAVHFIDSYLIIRILSSGQGRNLEPWLSRIYRERDVLFRRLSKGEPQFPWLTEEEIAEQERNYELEDAQGEAAPPAGHQNQKNPELADDSKGWEFIPDPEDDIGDTGIAGTGGR